MKKSYATLILVFAISLAYSQTFEFSLSFVGVNPSTNNYQVAFIATPSSSVSSGVTNDMGGGFYVPTGFTIGNFEMGNSNIPASEWSSQSLGSNGNGDAYFISRVEGGGGSIIFNGSGPFQLVLFDIIADPNPTTGAITFIENGDPIFDTLFVQNYININLGSGTIDAYAQNDPMANSIEFSTLNTNGFDKLEFQLYPNPSNGFVFIKGNTGILNEIEILSITGQKVLVFDENLNRINIESLSSGVYFVKITIENTSQTIKLVKN